MCILLVAVLLALALGHVAPQAVSRLRRYTWFARELRWLDGWLGEAACWKGRYGIVIALAPALLACALLQWWLHGRVDGFGLPAVIFDISVLVCTWGPRDLDVDVEAILDSHEPQARAAAVAHLWPLEPPVRSDAASLVEAVFVGALQRWFGVVLWFLVFGPCGALLFRLVELSVAGDQSSLLPEAARHGARRLRAWLQWPVAQLMTLALALAGNYVLVREAWRSNGGKDLGRFDIGFLVAAARASVRRELDEDAEEFTASGLVPNLPELPELRDAMSLVWRVLLIWMAVLAVLVIGGWIG